MQPITWVSDVESTFGATGYSVLQKTWGGEVKRMTLLFLRGTDGFTKTCLIVPAEAVAGAF
jgi:hypothetical protein